jgi:two-component system OmpR family response regulator
MDGAQVLVVDDELAIREFVSLALRYSGHEVSLAGSVREAQAAMAIRRPDLIVLDVGLPDDGGAGDGFSFAEKLRQQADDVPILFLTARDAVADRVRGLQIGDDYLVKPFAVDEFLARVGSVLRRTRASAQLGRLVFDDLELDDAAREVRRAGAILDLTDTEYRLLRYLMSNPRRVLTREQLLEHVWQYDFAGDSGVLATYISYLRKKIDAHGPPLIQTVRAVGYVLRPL